MDFKTYKKQLIARDSAYKHFSDSDLMGGYKEWLSSQTGSPDPSTESYFDCQQCKKPTEHERVNSDTEDIWVCRTCNWKSPYKLATRPIEQNAFLTGLSRKLTLVGFLMLLLKSFGMFDFGSSAYSGTTTTLTNFLMHDCDFSWTMALRLDPTSSLFGQFGLTLFLIGGVFWIVRLVAHKLADSE